MVPLQVENSLAGLKNIKKLIVGGAKMSKSLENSLLKKTEVYETYGMTETVTHIAAKSREDAFAILPNIKFHRMNCLVIDALKFLGTNCH
jgi:O-succinylbenzoic acid--CoA ligase